MKKIILSVFVIVSALGFFAPEQTIIVKGSDTMVILAQRWAEKYMESHHDIIVQVSGGGSGVGIAALINGAADIANASRPMKPSEREKLKQRYNSLGVEIKSAKDGLSIYLNENNPVNELSLQQIKDIYTGKITNWKQVGGNDSRIILFGRENSSGTFVYFKDNVLEGQEFSEMIQNMPGTAAVVNAVANNKNAVGFGGVAYTKGIKDAAVKKDANSKAYLPTVENIKTGDYPIIRYLYLYTRTRPAGVIKDYIEWILSEEGQEVVKSAGYFSLQ